MKKNFLYFIFILLIIYPVFSQSQSSGLQPSGLIVYAEGTGFDVIHEGNISYIDLSAGDDPSEVSLYAGDVINTYDNTFIEIQLTPSSNMIKISENSSFTLEETSSEGGGSFVLNYGRVRAKVVKLFGSERFRITGPSMVAGVRGTDFGYNSIADMKSGGMQVSEVYCFEGSVAVQLISGEEKDEVLIKTDEMVTEITGGEGEQGKLKISGLTPEIKTYWKENDFKSNAEITEKDTTQSSVVQEEIKSETAGLNRKSQLKRAALITGISGLLLEAAGTAIYFSNELFPSLPAYDNRSISLAVFAAGGVLIGSSVLNLVLLAGSGN